MLISALPFCTTHAKEWLDVTDFYIVNPWFDGSTQGWTNSITGYQNAGYQGAYYANGDVWIGGFAEAWIPSPSTLGNGSFSQKTTLPAGRYRLNADAIATKQSSNNWWGGEGSSNVSGVSLFALMNGTTRSYKTITTEDGKPQHFSLQFNVATNSVVEFGININNTTANWVASDNYTLEVYTDYVALIGLNIDHEELQMELGESQQLNAVYVPTDATYQGVTWESADETVARVDANGKVTAVGKGTTEIIATSKSGSITASCTVTVSFTTPTTDALVINEIQVSNLDMFMDPSYNFGGWIELYNQTDKAATLNGLYVSDDADNLKKYQLTYLNGSIPAHGYKNLWFDHHGPWNFGEMAQVSFKLNYEGGTIIISDGESIIAQQDYPAAVSRTSYARTEDGGEIWALSADPTPEKTNSGMAFATEQLAEPVINGAAGFFNGAKNITVEIPEGCTLRYTSDGSTPTLTNGETSTNGKLEITSSKAYRFRLFKDGYLPSDPVTHSYLINNKGYKLPVISIATDRNNIYGSELGLFSSGSQTKGRAGNGQDQKCNWNMDWDKPVNFEFFDVDEDGNHVQVLSQEVDMAMCGGWSRAYTPHAFKLKANKLYQGRNFYEYQFFENKPYLKHKTLQIRNGGNDNGARLKDPALQQIVTTSGLYVDGQSWKPVSVYINGSFYAVLNMREPNNKHFAYANYGIDTDLMDQFEMSPDSAYVQMEGTSDAFDQLVDLSFNASDDAVYDEICQLVDIDEYINYMAVELYLCNWDWPQNNVKGFRDREGGKFHFVLFDLDGSFNMNNPFSTFSYKEYYTFDAIRGVDAYGNNIAYRRKYNENIKFVTLFKNLTTNERFRKHFVDAFCIIGASVFEPTRSQKIITEMEKIMTTNGVSASGTASSLRSSLSTSRQTTMVNALKNDGMDFGVGGKTAQSVNITSNVEGAGLTLNGLPVPTGKISGPMYSPITITALAPAGYEFKGWKPSADEIPGRQVKLIEKGASWKYYDAGSLDGKNWTATDYQENWSSGAAPLGYDYADPNQYPNKPRVTTETRGNKPTYYFRKDITLTSEPTDKDEFTLNYTLDDGMVLYVNGKEIARDNMPSGTISYNSFASTYANDNPNSNTLQIPASAFVKGKNVIAVEIHNNNSSSTDAFWDAELSQLTYSSTDDIFVSTDPSYTFPTKGAVKLTAWYEKVEDKTCPVKINEVSAGNTMYVNDYFKKDDWVELYNTSDEAIDVDGWYISDNLSKPEKYEITSADGQQTVIPAKGHLVVWASKRDAIGEMTHLSFKLGNEDGECVLLTSADHNYTDTLTYVAHSGQESVGLYPDGTNNVLYFTRPTIGHANYLTTYDEYLYTKQPAVYDPDSTEINGITTTVSNGNGTTEYYSLDGLRVNKPSSYGITIVRMPDGKVIKRR